MEPLKEDASLIRNSDVNHYHVFGKHVVIGTISVPIMFATMEKDTSEVPAITILDIGRADV